MADYEDFVILAEAMIEADFNKTDNFCKFMETEACIHNTLWKVHYDKVMGAWESTNEYFTARLEDILPRNETCHAEILFISDKNSITHKFYDKFGLGDRKRATKHIHQERTKNYTHRAAVFRILEEKQKYLIEFDNRWAKDVTFVVNGEKCAGDRQYLSAISPVFKKILQDHAQDEITLEGVESADVLKDFFLAISPFRVQPNPTNVVSLLKLAQDYDIPFLMRDCEEHLKHCYEIPIKDRYLLAMEYGLDGLHEDIIKILKDEKTMREKMVTELEESLKEGYSYKKDKKELMTAIEKGTKISLLLKTAEESFIEKKQNNKEEFSKENILREFENCWAKDVTFVVNGEKCAGDRQYLSAISPVFKQILALRWRKQDKRMLQDHAQDEITLEGVESADELKDLFLAISPLRVQPNPTNVVSLLKLADYYDIPFLMRNCEELLKQCSEIPAIDRFLLAMKYDLSSLRLSIEQSLSSDDLIKILDELSFVEQKRKVLERASNKDLAEILKKKKDILSDMGTEFPLQNIAELIMKVKALKTKTSIQETLSSFPDLLQLITFYNGASANSPSGYDKPSPLDIAVLKDDPRLVTFLLSKGADPNLKHGCFGSALHIACCSGPTRPGRLAIIEQLLRYGADPNLHEPSTSGVGMKSPMVEFLRCTDSEWDELSEISRHHSKMFANIISKRSLSILRIVGSQVRPLTSIYGVEVKSSAKFSYSAAVLTKYIHNNSNAEPFFDHDRMTDYKDFVIVAEAKTEAEFSYYERIEACIHNTLWKVHYEEQDWDFTENYFTAHLIDILPRNETCHAEILFIDDKNSITHKCYDKFAFRDQERATKPKYQEQRQKYTHIAAVIRILEEKQKYLIEFEHRWAKDVTFVVNGEKCAGDRQYLSAISPVFKKMLQDHAQDEITLEGVESADVLKDFFLAISPLRVQSNPTNVVPLLKLAQDFDIPFLLRNCEEHLKHCYEIPTKDRYLLAMKYSLNGLHEDIIKILKVEKKTREQMMTVYKDDFKDEEEKMTAIEKRTEISLLLKTAEESFIEKKQNIEEEFLKENILKEFENRWAKDVTFVVNGEKCAGDRQYLSAISPVFKKMLQDHAQDEITLEGVESADVLKDFFLAISPLRVQPSPTNVVPILKLAHDYDIPFLVRSCEECLKQCSKIPAIDRFLLAMKYDLSGLKLCTEKSFRANDLIKILGALNDLEQKREVLDRLNNKRLAEILKKKKDILSEIGAEFLLENIAERMGKCNCDEENE
ncbi:BTB/POZ domain-containing protein [Ditylenchus destructor]|nr:BTB/POZ domain-containing protein [Ditylenchus destructor]